MTTVSSPASDFTIDTAPLNVRWLGRVDYDDAWALQRALSVGKHDHLLLLEHQPVFTLGPAADPANLLVDADQVGAKVRSVERGGDITVHAPGQLVGYPIITVPGRGGLSATAAYVESLEQLLIDVLADVGLPGAGRVRGFPGVWLDPNSPNERKIAALGVRVRRNRSLHGFALNVDIDPAWFARIVPCGISDKAVTSLQAEGIDTSMRDIVDAIVDRAHCWWSSGRIDRADVAWTRNDADLAPFSRGEGPGEAPPLAAPTDPTKDAPVKLLGRLDEASKRARRPAKPDWMRVKADMSTEFVRLKSVMRELDLTTVCEEAGCPNIFECWADGAATFMINGERCTRACGFCMVDTRKPEPLDPDEPRRVAEAVERLGLDYAVVTTVARDDLADHGVSGFVDTAHAIRQVAPDCRIEFLISDCRGDTAALDSLFASQPDVLNHNVETVARLQRRVRPSSGYARSLSVLARAKEAGLVTKSSLIVGMGETFDELVGVLTDLAAVGVDIVTAGQYLRPTTNHLPIDRWVEPAEFDELIAIGESLGIGHIEASPLGRSSYHARQSHQATTPFV